MKCKCGKEIEGMNYALSRKDNKTRLCPDCGTNEAIEDYAKSKKPHIEEVVIHVQPHSEEGFEYSIYKDFDAFEDGDTLDGGFFDGTFEEAINDAVETAHDIIKRLNR